MKLAGRGSPLENSSDRDDAHRLLGVVAAVAQAVGGRGDELEAPEQPLHPAGRGASEDPQ